MCVLWLQGREGEASQALKQAQRCKLDNPDLLSELGDKYTELGRFDSAADCLARAVAAQDGVKVGMLRTAPPSRQQLVLQTLQFACCWGPTGLVCSTPCVTLSFTTSWLAATC